MRSLALCLAAAAFSTASMAAQSTDLTMANIAEANSIVIKPVKYRGKSALEIRDAVPNSTDDLPRLAIIKGTDLRDGTVEVSLSGDTAPDAPANLRGFVGIAFHVGKDRIHYECIYLRPKNGRSSDPVQRSHSTQYVAEPDYNWDRLRAETPGKYESYVDIVAGEWIRVRIHIAGKRTELYVNDAKQPTLVVDDPKGTVDKGPIALWIGPGTIANFAELSVHSTQ